MSSGSLTSCSTVPTSFPQTHIQVGTNSSLRVGIPGPPKQGNSSLPRQTLESAFVKVSSDTTWDYTWKIVPMGNISSGGQAVNITRSGSCITAPWGSDYFFSLGDPCYTFNVYCARNPRGGYEIYLPDDKEHRQVSANMTSGSQDPYFLIATNESAITDEGGIFYFV